MVRWVVGLILHGVDPLSYFSFQPVLHDIWLRTILIVREETRCHHIGYSFWLAARLFYMNQPMSGHSNRIGHTTAFVTPVMEHWLEREIAHEGSIRWPIAPWAHALTTELHLAPLDRTRNSSMGSPWGIDPTTHEWMLYHEATFSSFKAIKKDKRMIY